MGKNLRGIVGILPKAFPVQNDGIPMKKEVTESAIRLKRGKKRRSQQCRQPARIISGKKSEQLNMPVWAFRLFDISVTQKALQDILNAVVEIPQISSNRGHLMGRRRAVANFAKKIG